MLGAPLRAVHAQGCLHSWCVRLAGFSGRDTCAAVPVSCVTCTWCSKGRESRMCALLSPNDSRLTTQNGLFLPDQLGWAPGPQQVSLFRTV